MIISSFIFLSMKYKESFKLVTITVVLMDVLLVLTCRFISSKIKFSESVIKFKAQSKLKNLIYSISLILGYILIKCLIIYTLSEISYFRELNHYESFFVDSYLKHGKLIGYVIIFLQIIIVGPILEEILFRGILLKSLLNKYYEKPFKAIIYSSVVFAIIHMNLIQSITALLGAFILGIIYYYTRSIKICIFLHIINNFLAIVRIPTNSLIAVIYLILGLYLINIGYRNLINKNEKNVD
ncbi:CPBP family intramembrane glutamic endopeptidase [Paraclostridium sordellii]|uniref:CPBP family intramembrane glutamic endopeptidase n=1 Tax=Paraclostridium sordellii TaxID=1505 RepID=UPI001C61279D|nr:CPBP family intramembrane glutamic endopeptidase [Paeniclostridium sordellii]QYE98705.1 CPBP family intramembrane metalloprotease [Paeniclostridium sordellii]